MASVSACSDKGSPGRFASALPGQEEQQQHTQPGGKNVKTFSMCGRCTLRVATPFPSHTSRSPKRSG
ncbi:unnamed protein product, partial [Ascophyllum nodosum]